MAKDKKSFILYADQKSMFDKLPDKLAGKLIKHIFAYVNDEDPQFSQDDFILEIAFEPIKLQMKRDLMQWEKRKDNKSNAGVIGNLKRWHPDLYEIYKKEPERLSELQNIANGRSAIQSVANIAVNDNVNVTVNDNVNVNESKEKTSDKNKFLRERELLRNVKDYFDEDIIRNLKKSDVEKWCDTIEKLKRIDGYDFETIEKVIIFARTDDFWKSNFNSVASLRKKRDGLTKFQTILKKMQYGNKQSNADNQRAELARAIAEDIANDPDFKQR